MVFCPSVSTVTPHTTLPRKPLGRTFIVAISLLGLFAAIQVLAVIGHFIPTMRQQLAANALRNQEAASQAATPARPEPAPAATSAQAAAHSAEVGKKTERLVAEAAKSVRIGEYDAALQILEEAEAMVPGDPKILQIKALVLERLDQPADAAVALESALRYPGLPAHDRAAMERKLDQLSASLGTVPERNSSSASSFALESPAIEENGVPIGSNLGIVDIRASDSEVGVKTIQVAVKSRENTKINGSNVKIAVYFYEESTVDGDISASESPVPNQWLSSPIDWANNEPELLRMQYSVPAADSGKKYFGYVLGVYYDNELQDFRSEPSKLAKDFPLPLFLKSAE